MEPIQSRAGLFPGAEVYLDRGECTKLIFFFVVVDVEPKLVSDGKVFLLDLHTGLDGLSPLDGLLDDLVNVVHIDTSLPDQVVKPDQISIPNLYCEDVRVHVFRLGRVEHRELEPIVEVSLRPARPMGVRLLRLRSSNHSTHKHIVRLHLYVFVDAIIGRVDDDS